MNGTNGRKGELVGQTFDYEFSARSSKSPRAAPDLCVVHNVENVGRHQHGSSEAVSHQRVTVGCCEGIGPNRGGRHGRDVHPRRENRREPTDLRCVPRDRKQHIKERGGSRSDGITPYQRALQRHRMGCGNRSGHTKYGARSVNN